MPKNNVFIVIIQNDKMVLKMNVVFYAFVCNYI